MNAVQLGFSIAARIQTSGEDVCEVLNISISATQKDNTLLQRCNWQPVQQSAALMVKRT